jgi:hypothetical protein
MEACFVPCAADDGSPLPAEPGAAASLGGVENAKPPAADGAGELVLDLLLAPDAAAGSKLPAAGSAIEEPSMPNRPGVPSGLAWLTEPWPPEA